MTGYLYRHIRLDKNEPFYIGIGTVKENNPLLRSRYERAFSKLKRNNFWKNIIKNSKYEVEILLESDDKDFIIQKEIEFIKLYGRKDLGLGTLCNMTDGGEGSSVGNKINLGRKMTTETKKKLSLANKGKTNYFNKSKMIKIYQYDLKGNFIKEYPSLLSTKKNNLDPSTVAKCCKKLRKTHKGFIFMFNKIDN